MGAELVIKLTKDLKPGDIFFYNFRRYVVSSYTQCVGMGSFDFGVYGMIEVWGGAPVQSYENYPVVVEA